MSCAHPTRQTAGGQGIPDQDRPAAGWAGYVVVPHDATGDQRMSNAAFRAWLALERWTYRGDYPTNAELASACGWFSADGRPAGWRAKRALIELERLGLVRRRTERPDGHWVRAGIEVTRPRDWSPTDPQGGGALAHQGVGRQRTRGGALAPHNIKKGEESTDRSIDRFVELGGRDGGQPGTADLEAQPSPTQAPPAPTQASPTPGADPAPPEAPAPRTAPEPEAPDPETHDAPPQAARAGRVDERAVEALARDLWGRVYAGADPGAARRDWEGSAGRPGVTSATRGWAQLYRRVARRVLSGELTDDQIRDAIDLARRAETRSRGGRFAAAVRDQAAGRTPAAGPAAGPAPVPTPVPPPPPPPPLTGRRRERYVNPPPPPAAPARATRSATDDDALVREAHQAAPPPAPAVPDPGRRPADGDLEPPLRGPTRIGEILTHRLARLEVGRQPTGNPTGNDHPAPDAPNPYTRAAPDLAVFPLAPEVTCGVG